MIEKAAIHASLVESLSNNILSLQQELTAQTNARNAETKSTAGDKHETAREMAQQSIDRTQASLARSRAMMEVLERMDVERACEAVQLGALVHTSSAIIYVSVAYGAFEIDGKRIMAASPSAPLIQGVLGSKVGAEISFGTQRFVIEKIQ